MWHVRAGISLIPHRAPSWPEAESPKSNHSRTYRIPGGGGIYRFFCQTNSSRSFYGNHALRPLLFQPLVHSFVFRSTPISCPSSAFRTLRPKTPGGGYPVPCARPFRGDDHAPNKSPACPDLVGVTNHQSPLWLSAPLRRTVFGATIRKGTRNLYDPGKQLRSPRCLTILSGHREPFDDVPGYTPTQSGSQVVPGSSVLTRVSGFVLTNPEQSGPQQGGPSNPSVQDGALNRVGKAGSVRLG